MSTANQPDAISSQPLLERSPLHELKVTSTVKRIPSVQMFGEAKTVEIEHEGAIYQLRQTKLGKLILTK